MLVFAMSISMTIRCVRRKFWLCKSKIVDILEFIFFCIHEYGVYDINLLKMRNRSILQNLKGIKKMK